MAKESDGRSDRYARFFWVPAGLALVTPPILLSIALLLHYTGSLNMARPVMNLAFYSTFICIFVSIIIVLSTFALLMFGKVRFTQIRRGAALALLGFVTNYFIFSYLVFNFYRPH